MLERGDVPPQRALQAVETIRRIGLPQAVRPGTTEDLPAPAVTPARLAALVSSISAAGLSRDERSRLTALRSWLAARAQQGVTESAYRLGTYDVHPGDWLLMRNPSPYNLFTDLSPGLFTHVGVVTTERGTDGITRMVIVDLPERGRLMPATNVETFLQRSLHYVFLRHPDPKVAETMAEAARQTIGNETEFDLNFRTERVLALAHTNLAGRKIQTYCAGMLLLCAVQTDVDRHAFFPLEEYAAGGYTVENLARLGMSFAKEFISPTGAMFSPTLTVAGRREPMYEPAREIEEAVFDRFATQLVDRPLDPAPELFDSLMVKVAAAASQNTLLAGALARAAGVGNDVDLVGARAVRPSSKRSTTWRSPPATSSVPARGRACWLAQRLAPGRPVRRRTRRRENLSRSPRRSGSRLRRGPTHAAQTADNPRGLLHQGRPRRNRSPLLPRHREEFNRRGRTERRGEIATDEHR